MPKKRKNIDKKTHKLAQGKCRICGEDNYAVLDNHRIKEGREGGTYERFNTVALCSNCHRRVHNDEITIYGYYLATSGKYMLKISIDGKEFFV